jgi:thermostable 8-oxoguanine DNA glycosylase
MIDPNNIINYRRTNEELEELLLFLVCVAGKKASTVSKQLELFLKTDVVVSPFNLIKVRNAEGLLRFHLERGRFGQYTKIGRAFRELANSGLNLKTCTNEDLIAIHGIGRKSASCFLAWTRRGENVAMLDTHILKYLREIKSYNLEGIDYWKPTVDKLNSVNIPKSTPSNKRVYDTLEQAYLEICDIYGQNPTEFDLKIWKFYSQKFDKKSQTDII